MFTLRRLANSQYNEYSLYEWIKLANKSGVNISPDEEINADMLLQISAYMSQQTQKKRVELAGIEAVSTKNMEKLIQDNYIFIDLSSLLVPTADKTFRRMVPLLRDSEKKLNILNSALAELSRIAEDQSDMERRNLAIHNSMKLTVIPVS